MASGVAASPRTTRLGCAKSRQKSRPWFWPRVTSPPLAARSVTGQSSAAGTSPPATVLVRRFFVASSAVGTVCLICFSRSAVRLPPLNLAQGVTSSLLPELRLNRTGSPLNDVFPVFPAGMCWDVAQCCRLPCCNHCMPPAFAAPVMPRCTLFSGCW